MISDELLNKDFLEWMRGKAISLARTNGELFCRGFGKVIKDYYQQIKDTMLDLQSYNVGKMPKKVS